MPIGPQLHDIEAIRLLYDLNLETRTGDTFYYHDGTFLDVQSVSTIYDAGGIDTLDFSRYATNQVINLHAGAFSNVGALTKKRVDCARSHD